MSEIIHTVCPVCGKSAIEHSFACKDYFATGEQFDVDRCKECGFAFTQKVPDEKEINRYYESSAYVSHSNTKKGVVNKLFHAVRRIMLRRKVNLMEKLTYLKNGTIVDYGAGTGYFAHAMQRKGWTVAAIEKSEAARTYAKEAFGLEMLPESGLDGIERGSVDIITMWHVLEHVQNIDAMWEKMHALLDVTGIAVIAVPNSLSYDAKYYGKDWAAYDVPRHLWHFTPSTIAAMGRKHGFILEKMMTMPFDGFYISILSEKNRGSSLPLIKGMWRGFRGWLKTCTKREASSSLIYVFRKKQ